MRLESFSWPQVTRRLPARGSLIQARSASLEVAQFLLWNGNPTRERGIHLCVLFPRLRVGFPKNRNFKKAQASGPLRGEVLKIHSLARRACNGKTPPERIATPQQLRHRCRLPAVVALATDFRKFTLSTDYRPGQAPKRMDKMLAPRESSSTLRIVAIRGNDSAIRSTLRKWQPNRGKSGRKLTGCRGKLKKTRQSADDHPIGPGDWN